MIPDTVAALYLGAFVAGTVLVLLVTLTGMVGDDGDASDGDPTPFNLPTLLGFVTFFGGVGYISYLAGARGITSLYLALLGGLLGGAVIFFTLVRFLYRRQTPYLKETDFALPGTIARVTSSIAEHGVGEIVFTKGDRRRVEGARSVDGVAIGRDREVVIVRYERGLAYVEPSSTFFDDARFAELDEPRAEREPS